MNEADLVAATLRAQEAGQVRQVEPEKRQPEERGGKAGQEEEKGRGKRTDYFERTSPPEGEPPADEDPTRPEDEEAEPESDAEHGKHINTLA